MSVHQARLSALGQQSQAEVLTLWRRHLNGEISSARFSDLAALAIARNNLRAVTLADLALTAALIRELQEGVLPLGLMPTEREVDRGRLREAVGVVLSEQVEVSDADELARSRGARLGRLARAEPLTTSQDAFGRAMQERQIPGWTRATSTRPCPLCKEWADGVVRPATTRMARHAACSCTQVPAFREISPA